MIYYVRIDVVEWKFALDIYVRVKLGFGGAFIRVIRFEISANVFADINYRLFYYSDRWVGLRVRCVGSLCNHDVFRSAEQCLLISLSDIYFIHVFIIQTNRSLCVLFDFR